jgi:hypothetical protein
LLAELMFAILIYDRDQLRLAELASAVQTWLQDAGGFAAVALAIWGLAYAVRRWVSMSEQGSTPWTPQSRLFATALAGAALAYLAFFLALLLEGTTSSVDSVTYTKPVSITELTPTENLLLTIAGALALTAVLIPVIFGLGRLRPRRIWAIARLAIKETIRQRVLWVFSALLLVILFASWFLDSDKPEFQLRNYIFVVDWSTTVLLLLAASLLAAFSIPADVKSQTIHTVVTKPVERFEIVLGRFLGYSLLMTAVLVVVTALSLLYLFRNINEEAKKENYKARVPVYGRLAFMHTQGEHSGREWTHRMYIAGARHQQPGPVHYAVWSFQDVPERLAERSGGVTCEFSFDIYRTHKGEEGKGIFCAFLFVTRNCPLVERGDRLRLVPAKADEIKKTEERLIQEGKRPGEIKEVLAEKYGIFEVPSKEVTDYHTQSILVPAALFKNLQREEQPGEGADSTDEAVAPLRVILNVHDEARSNKAQLVGVAPQDLYFLDAERLFEVNFFKAAVGLWFRLCLLIGLAVACSTYLSGIISWLCAGFLFGLGLFKPDIQELAVGGSDVGGPIESMMKLANRQPIAAQLEQTPTVQVGTFFDEVYRWVLGRFLKLIPDVNRFDLSSYIANGFDISWTDILVVDGLVRFVGYLVPCLVLAYYLIKYREVANPS